MRPSLNDFSKCVSKVVSVLFSDVEKVMSSIGFLIKVKTQLQILTLRTCDPRTGSNNRLAFLDSFIRCPKVEGKIMGRSVNFCVILN